MAILRVKDLNGEWQEIDALKGEPGEQGLPGEPGVQGEPGYTPVRGKDYWTSEDINAIETYINNSIDTKITNELESDF